MRRLLIGMMTFLFMVSPCLAARVCLEKATGKLIEYQSGNPTPRTLINNAIGSGYRESDIVEKEVTDSEWKTIRQQWIVDPARKDLDDRKATRKVKADSIKAKLGLSDEEFSDLKEAVRD